MSRRLTILGNIVIFAAAAGIVVSVVAIGSTYIKAKSDYHNPNRNPKAVATTSNLPPELVIKDGKFECPNINKLVFLNQKGEFAKCESLLDGFVATQETTKNIQTASWYQVSQNPIAILSQSQTVNKYTANNAPKDGTVYMFVATNNTQAQPYSVTTYFSPVGSEGIGKFDTDPKTMTQVFLLTPISNIK